MKRATLAGSTMLFLAAALACAPVYAAEEDLGAIVSINVIHSPRLAFYKSASNDSKLKEIDKTSVKLPLPVFETADRDRFLKVSIDGDTLWVKMAHVGVQRAVTAGCLAQQTAPVAAGVIRGGNRGCAK